MRKARFPAYSFLLLLNVFLVTSSKHSMAEEKHLVVSKTARYFIHGNASAKTREVWFIIHGYGQLAKYFIRHFSHFNPETHLVVAPEGLSKFYLEGTTPDSRIGATWMTKEDREAEIKDYVNYLDSLHDQVISQLGKEVKVKVFGFSQGCSTLCRWVAYGKVQPKRMVMWAGTFPPDIDLKEFGSRFHGYEVDVVYGKQDEYLSWINAEEITQWTEQAGIDFRVTTFEGKHEIIREVLNKLLEIEQEAD